MNSRLGVTATVDMGVLGCHTLRRTIQVRLGLDFGFLTTIDDIELHSSDFASCSLVLMNF